VTNTWPCYIFTKILKAFFLWNFIFSILCIIIQFVQSQPTDAHNCYMIHNVVNDTIWYI
jgi:hypothetical protein